jgi:hypothetical protein
VGQHSLSRVSVRGASSGTLVYMSPQQAQGQAPKAADDIYAIGATFYELLTSKPPFYSGNIQHQLDTVVPPSMAERRAELEIESAEPIPEDWERTIAACLAKDPADRPQSVAQMGEWLGLRPPTTTLVPLAAFPTNGAAKTAKTARSIPAPTGGDAPPSRTGLFIGIGVAAAVVLLLAGGLGYYFGVVVPANKQRQAEIAKQQADAAVAKAQEEEKEKADAAAAVAAAQAKSDEEKAAAAKAQQEAEARAAAAEQAAKEAQVAAENARQAVAAAAASNAAPVVPPPPVISPQQIAHENQVTAQVQMLINQKKLGSALYHLQLLTNSEDKDRAATINAPFQSVLEPYQQQRDAAIAASQTGDPTEATTQLKTFAEQNPDDPKIKMALATIATRMPPSHSGLRDQLKQFKSMAAQDQAVATDPDFVALQNKFANELKQLDALSSNLDGLKASKNHGSLAELQAERTDAQSKLASYQLIKPGSLLYLTVASSIQDKEREIASLNQKINAIQNHPAASQSDIDDAQQKYDDFVAAVPW